MAASAVFFGVSDPVSDPGIAAIVMNTYAVFALMPVRATKLARLYGLPVFP